MENKLIFLGLLFALLRATHAKEADPDPYLDDGSITIYVDAGKEINNYLTLSKQIEKTQNLIESALERMSEEIKAMAKRISDQAKATEEKCNQQVTEEVKASEERMSAEAKAAEERLNQRVTAEAKATEQRLNQRVTEEVKATEERMSAEAKAAEERLNQRVTAEAKATQERLSAEAKATEERLNQRVTEEVKATGERMSAEVKATEERISAEVKATEERISAEAKATEESSEVATPDKRPAERACEEIKKDLRSLGQIEFFDFAYYVFKLFTPSSNISKICVGAFVDKRFVLTSGDCLHPQQFTTVKFYPSEVDKEIKTIHIHANYSKSPSLHNIGLIELNSDVNYTHSLFPVCLPTSQVDPESDMTRAYIQVEILADTECPNMNTTNLQPSQICVRDLGNGCSISGDVIFVETKEFYKYQLLGIVGDEICNRKPYVITKVFDYLEFIENVVWPKNGN